MKKLALAGFFAIQNLFTQFGGHEQELRTKFDLSIGGSRNLPKKERKPKNRYRVGYGVGHRRRYTHGKPAFRKLAAA